MLKLGSARDGTAALSSAHRVTRAFSPKPPARCSQSSQERSGGGQTPAPPGTAVPPALPSPAARTGTWRPSSGAPHRPQPRRSPVAPVPLTFEKKKEEEEESGQRHPLRPSAPPRCLHAGGGREAAARPVAARRRAGGGRRAGGVAGPGPLPHAERGPPPGWARGAPWVVAAGPPPSRPGPRRFPASSPLSVPGQGFSSAPSGGQELGRWPSPPAEHREAWRSSPTS